MSLQSLQAKLDEAEAKLAASEADNKAKDVALAKAKRGQDKALTFDSAPQTKLDKAGKPYTVWGFKGGTGRDFNVGAAKLAAHAANYAQIIKIPAVIDHLDRIKAAGK